MTGAAMAMGNRDQVTQWQSTSNWDDIDKAVDDENQLKVAARFLSPYPLPDATSALGGGVPLGKDRILTIPQSEMIPNKKEATI
jgi:hypothetical protein